MSKVYGAGVMPGRYLFRKLTLIVVGGFETSLGWRRGVIAVRERRSVIRGDDCEAGDC